MFFSPRAKLKQLTDVTYRLRLALEAGIDVRSVFAREADRADGPMKRHLTSVSQAIDQGSSLTEAFRQTDDYFPPLLHEMIEVGEHTGELDTVMKQLSNHYREQLTIRRQFLATITWPLIQLGITLLFIGVIIWLMGLLQELGMGSIDPFGFGLVGNRGLRIYITFLAAVAITVWLLLRAIKRGVIWIRPVQRFILKLPVIGMPLETIALARLAWTMQITMATGMSVRRALALSLRSTQNARFTDDIPTIDAEIMAGNSIHESFEMAGGYPLEFVDTIAVGEESGKISESLGHLARQYQERAVMALSALAKMAAWGVWVVIAVFIIVMIFRVAAMYIGTIHKALNMR